MKKPTNRKNSSNADLSIKTSLPDVGLLLYLVEMLAARRYETGYSFEKMPLGWQAIETSTIEAFINGDTTLSNTDTEINNSFTSSFLFTCLKSRGQDYRFNWLTSLS